VENNWDPEARKRGQAQQPGSYPGSQPRLRPTEAPGEDPDLLRQIVQQSRGAPLNVQRITSTEIKALKVTSDRQAKVSASFSRRVIRLFQDLLQSVTGVFAREEQHRSQCDIYGHVIKEGWRGDFPKCFKCGQQVTDLSQLRGSRPKD